MAASSSASSRDSRDADAFAPADTAGPIVGPDISEFPENVIPLRATQSAPQSVPTPIPADPNPSQQRLVEADPANPAHTPSPIFGHAALNLPQWPLVLVSVGIIIGLGVAVFDSFRLGSILFAGALVLAFFLRLVLTDREAGMLKVRSRVIDLIVLGAFAGGMLLVSLALPV